MTYKHKQLSTKLVGADFSAPRASFPACTEPHPELVEGRSKLACAELVEASKHRSVEASNPVEVSLYHHVKSSNLINPSVQAQFIASHKSRTLNFNIEP